MGSGFASFRDPDGSVLIAEEGVFRVTTATAAAMLEAALQSPPVRRMLEDGKLVRTNTVAPGETPAFLLPELLAWRGEERPQVFLHERIPFPSYPYEWPPEMLHAAAELTIEVALELLPSGFGIKDASPYNVLFRGAQPVFVDVLSFEPRDPHDPIWLPYAQFVRTFLLPLALNRHLGLPLDQLMLSRRDGLDPEEVYRWLPVSRRLRRPFLSLVSIPVWLARRKNADGRGIYRSRSVANPDKARFMLETLLAGLRRSVKRAGPKSSQVSAWSGYEEKNSYPRAAAAAKEAFVRDALREFRPRRVLDVGANTGRFSQLAAAAGASVVAVDSDPVVAGAIWRAARSSGADILPLVIDLGRPSPATGWRNQECPSFLSRAEGKFDAVFMLALLHHLVVTERIPLSEVIDLAAGLTTGVAVIEFVAREDAMFQQLLRGRDRLYTGITEAAFESCATRRFDIVRRQPLEGMQRTLYLLRKR